MSSCSPLRNEVILTMMLYRLTSLDVIVVMKPTAHKELLDQAISRLK